LRGGIQMLWAMGLMGTEKVVMYESPTSSIHCYQLRSSISTPFSFVRYYSTVRTMHENSRDRASTPSYLGSDCCQGSSLFPLEQHGMPCFPSTSHATQATQHIPSKTEVRRNPGTT